MAKSTQRTAGARAAAAGVVVVVMALVSPVAPVRAGGFLYEVTSLGDTSATDGLCTLREAIASSNGGATECGPGSSGADGIGFAVDGTIVLASPLPEIAGEVSIDATGRSVAISSSPGVDAISVDEGATLVLVALAIANDGIGVENAGTVHATGVTFANHQERAVKNANAATMTISQGKFVNNIGDGAIVNDGTLTVTATTFNNNDQTSGSAGGAITNGGTLVVNKSTFTRNDAEHGGAIATQENATISNSTFVANHALSGGAILAVGPGEVTLTNVTLSANTAIAGTAIRVSSENASATFRNTLVSGDTTGLSCQVDPGGTLVDGGNNLSWPDTSCPGLNVAPKLDPNGLRDNGGRTRTVALRWNSPAIDRGNGTTCQIAPINNKDQRGGIRPIDGDLIGVARCDIGAFEYGGLRPPAPLLRSAVAISGGREQLTWSRARDALRYMVEVRKAGSLVASRTTTDATTAFTLGSGSFTWTVQACNTRGCTRSATGSFSR